MVDLTPNPEYARASHSRDDAGTEMGKETTKPRYDARDLIGGNTTVEIELNEQIYTLRITKSGKLILTK